LVDSDDVVADTRDPESHVEEWITLQAASELLGVAASTVRRWADAGRLPVKRTLGGHRRFERVAVLELARSLADDPDGALAAATLASAGGGPDDPARHEWLAQLITRPGSRRMRELGQQLLGVLIQYVNRPDMGERFLGEARAIGRRYGAEARAADVGMVDTVEAFLLFRNVHAPYAVPLPRPSHPAGLAEHLALRERVDRFMDTLLLGVVAGHEGAGEG
jgi:excisionase family DNA binding protein